MHIGYEGGDGTYGFYLQGGPAMVSPDGGDVEMELSGKIGGSVQATEQLWCLWRNQLHHWLMKMPAFGTKIGAKYSF